MAEVYDQQGVDVNFHSGFLDLNMLDISKRQAVGKQQSKVANVKLKETLAKQLEQKKNGIRVIEFNMPLPLRQIPN